MIVWELLSGLCTSSYFLSYLCSVPVCGTGTVPVGQVLPVEVVGPLLLFFVRRSVRAEL
jgi:hypothetical protein